MADILKTWPATMDRRRVLEAFTRDWGGHFYFTLGRGKPKEHIERLWYTHHGQIIGCFTVDRIVRNDGTNIPKLRSISGEVSEWQIKPDAYVALCKSSFVRLKEKLYHSSFRGWHYFDLERSSAGAGTQSISLAGSAGSLQPSSATSRYTSATPSSSEPAMPRCATPARPT
jgi:hypothetical protein